MTQKVIQDGINRLHRYLKAKQAREKNLYGDDDSIEKELSELEYYSSLVLARLLLVLLP